MVDLAASDVTVTINRKEDRNGMRRNYVTIAFGDGALTYPSGGVPLAKGKLGFTRSVDSFSVIETNTLDYNVEYDISAETIRLGEDDDPTGNAPFTELTAATSAPAAQTIRAVFEGY